MVSSVRLLKENKSINASDMGGRLPASCNNLLRRILTACVNYLIGRSHFIHLRNNGSGMTIDLQGLIADVEVILFHVLWY